MPEPVLQLKLFDKETPPNSTIFVLGATGCGKTTLVANLLLARPRFVIFDVKEEYPESFFDNHTIIVRSLHELVNALNDGVARIIVRIPSDSTETQENNVNIVCFQLYEFQKVNYQPNNDMEVTFVLDEFNRFVSPTSSPKGLQQIITGGRGLGIQKIFLAQWFNQIPTWARDSFTEIYAFRHNEPRGILMLQNYGIDPDTIRRLPDHTVIWYRHGVSTVVRLTCNRQQQVTTVNV